MENLVVLVDENDNQIGVGEKLEVHRNGLLHRAFSIFVFNEKRELLLQQRAREKYHSGGLWANTCCSHPFPDEDLNRAAHRRLKEEMGFDCELREVGSFIYRAELEGGLVENELDNVFVGQFEGEPDVNPLEVAEYKWISMKDLYEDITKNPDRYVYWLKHILQNHGKKWFKND